jgi:hypothetical protein
VKFEKITTTFLRAITRDFAGDPQEARPKAPLEINVVLGGLENAESVLHTAASFATGLHAKLTIHFPRVVPYPLPLKSPPVSVELVERNLLELSARQAIETSANVYFCRDRSDTIREILKPGSLVILNVKRQWLGSFEKTLSRRLLRDGHRVVVVNAPKIPIKK